ncbi:MAG: RidA family protein [Natronomonas sp.]|nr:RidA family protein [Natronomonas sp.]MDR9430834.1 RidA family protein [Natronomonas sp.]
MINPGELFDATEFGFSQARERNGVLHLSGQIGVDSEPRVAGDDVESQARKAFENLGVALEAAGKRYDDVGKVVTYMVDLEDNVGGYREPWSEVFDKPYRVTPSSASTSSALSPTANCWSNSTSKPYWMSDL